jgi:hypothetical protein
MNPQSIQPAPASHPAPVSDASYDQPYTWGRPPLTYLNYRQVVRLTILRSRLEDVRTERLSRTPEA